MSCNKIQIMKNSDSIDIKQSSKNLQVFQTIQKISVCAQNPISNFIAFYFLAIQDQTVFTLPAIALSCQLCAINGTSQSQAKTPTPDFIITDNILTLSEGVDEGDTVFGVIQIV